MTLVLDRELDRKEQDRSDPNDKNKFTWKSKEIAIELSNYKIMNKKQPKDSLGNYIEGYRIFEGKREPHPGLKIFFTSGYNRMAIVIIDSDKSGKDPGYGLPDYLMQVAGIVSVRNIRPDGTILKRLFEEKSEEARREPPKQKKIFVEIARIGKQVDIWEKCPEKTGCLVPAKYWNDKKNNYTVGVHFKKREPGDTAEYRPITHITKKWTIGRVTEYYRPRPDFSGNVQVRILGRNRVRFIFEDGSEEQGTITSGKNKFIEDEPYAIAYNEGDERWWIEKSKGSSVFDKRKEIPSTEN